MISSTVLAATFGVLAVAQTTVVDIMLPAVDPQALVGSVVAASPAITTYVVKCADNVDDESECGLLHATTIAQGPSTWVMHYSHSDPEYGNVKQDMECDLDRENDRIACSVTMVEEYDGTLMTTSTAVATNGLDRLMVPVTITAGLDKLRAVPGATGAVSPAQETAGPDEEEDEGSDETSAEVTATASFTTKVARPTPSATDITESFAPTSSEQTSVNSQFTPTPTPTPSTVDEDNAALPRAKQNVLAAGLAIVVGGFMLL